MDTSFISHRMFVEALALKNQTKSKSRRAARVEKVEAESPPEEKLSPPGKEVMTAAMARQMFEQAMSRGT